MSINNWSHPIANTEAFDSSFQNTCLLENYESLNNLSTMLSVGNIKTLWTSADISNAISHIGAYPIPANILSQIADPQFELLELMNVRLDGIPSGSRAVNGAPIDPVIYINLGSVEIVDDMRKDFTYYDGYSEIDIFLPYYGIISLAPSDVFLFKYLYFRLSLNLTNSSGTYYILGSNDVLDEWTYTNDCRDFMSGTFLLTTVNVNIGYNIPITITNESEVVRNKILQGAVNAFKIAASVYVGSPAGAIPTGGHTTKTVVTNRLMKDKSSPTGKSMQEYQRRTTTVYPNTPVSDREMKQYKAGQISEVFDATMSAISGRVKTQNVSSGVTGVDMLYTSTSIHFIMRRPIVKEQPEQFNHLYGRPLGETRLLSTLSGYTQISNIHFDSHLLATATEEEKAMLKEACLQGIYL